MGIIYIYTNKINGKYYIEKRKNKDSFLETRPLSKKVICIETRVIYRSIGNAGKNTGIHYSGISKCCAGLKSQVKNLHWAYYKKEIE